MQKTQRFTTKTLVFAAACVALALALHMVKLFHLPQGGAVTACSMFFVALPGFWFGPMVGAVAGLVFGLTQMLVDGYVFHPGSFLFDYALAFAALGALPGCFKNLYAGYLCGAAARFASSFVSGLLFFAAYAQGSFIDGRVPGQLLPAVYSLWYNASYIVPEAAVTVILLATPPVRRALETAKRRLS